MIRYEITTGELRRRIEEQHPGWLVRAAQRTAQFQAASEYAESSSIWGEIKSVYMVLQYNKCAYCERCLSDGSIENDLEHYRPKRSVEPWPAPSKSAYDFATGPAMPEGYYLLAYHPLNYATACKRCNSNFKLNYFPIAGQRVSGLPTPQDYTDEMPFIPYPIGTSDESPETLLTFDGIIPLPNPHATEAQQRRAQVTIDFFGLATREDLRRERARVVQQLDMAWLLLQHGTSDDRALAQERVALSLAVSEPHTNCARCFHQLQQASPALAHTLAKAATALLNAVRT